MPDLDDRNDRKPAGGYRRTPSNMRRPKGAAGSSKAAGASKGLGTVGGSYVRDDRKFGMDEAGLHIPTGNSEVLLSRRQLLYGVAGLAGVAAVGGAATAVGSIADSGDQVESLAVATGDVFTLDDCAEVPTDDVFSLVGEYKLPFGSLVWAGSGQTAACLKPTQKASPLVTASIINLASGYESAILNAADGADEGFEIYDLRASDEGAIWTEANILSGEWRVLVAAISMMELQEHHQVDAGDAAHEMPTIAVIGDTAFWQVMPAQPPEDAENPDEDQTEVHMVAFGKPSDVKEVYTAPGRTATAIAPANAEEGVVVTPRHPDARSHRQMLLVGKDGQVKDSATFPSRMLPMEACYGDSGFAFSFESIYNYGEGIANLGTYTPQAKPEGGAYSNRSWFHFTRTPSMPPAWCDGWFVVKSTSAVVGVDLAGKRYTIFPTDNNAEAYGDCLASQGANGTVVVFTNIDRTAAVQDNEAVSDDDRICYVRVYATKEGAEDFGASGEDDYPEDDWDDTWAEG